MMPHPDRSSESLLGSADGLRLFRAMAQSLAAQ
jgi:phosphoribosylformylglycinamidine (FGAM) synthase-like amidotransferase family enzyme